jgi:phage tail protein X
MALVGTLATKKVSRILCAADGVAAAASAVALELGVTLPAMASHQIITQNIAADLADKSATVKYPLVSIYCAKIVNELREKFQIFSGRAEMVVEARLSQDRLEDLETRLQTFTAAITQVLDNNRGDWGDGVFFSGGYEISFTSVKHGGSNFLQTAKIAFDLQVSTN